MGELLESITSQELTEWAAYYQLDPFGSYREDLHAGIIASTLANVHARKGHTFSPTDFMPKFDAAEKRSMDPEDMLAMIRSRWGQAPHG